jgi:hypothetical protein
MNVIYKVLIGNIKDLFKKKIIDPQNGIGSFTYFMFQKGVSAENIFASEINNNFLSLSEEYIPKQNISKGKY